MLNCAAYLRVSTDSQAKRDTPISSQKTEILEWASTNNARVLEDWVIADEGVSGNIDNRPGFQHLMKATEDGTCPFNTILVYDRSRFFRNFKLANYYEVILEMRGIQLISVTETEEPALMTDIRGVVAAEMRRQIIKHTIRGMKENAKIGHRNGGPPSYGFKRVPLKSENGGPTLDRNENPIFTIEPSNPREVEVVRNIFKWYLEGEGYYSIVNRLNKAKIPCPGSSGLHGGRPIAKRGWSKSTIYGMLRNRAYIGEMIWNRTTKKGKPKPQEKWIIKENMFKGIVDKNTFEQVQIMLDARKRRYFEINAGGRKPSNKYLLSSVMVCASCGHHYAGHTYGKVKNGKKRFYWCSGYKTKGRYFCKWFPISANWIEDELFREIYLRLNSPELINLIVGKLNSRLNTQEQITADRLKEMGKALTKVDTELSRLIRVIKETDRSPQSIVDEISSLEGEKAQLLMEKEEIKLSNTP